MSRFFYQNKDTRSYEFQGFGLDYMRSYDSTVTDQSVLRGGRMGQAGNALGRIDEIQRARNLTNYTSEELATMYNPYNTIAVGRNGRGRSCGCT
jgi:hypothetical protein